MRDKFQKVCIVGVGLIGGSMALKMKELGLAQEIIGVGRTIANLLDAVKLGAIDGYTQEVERGVKDADLVVLSVPVRAMPKLVKSARKFFKPGAILTDVGSTKSGLIQALEPLLPPGIDFIPAHPIAGKEKTGAKFSDPELFQGRWTIITPSRSSHPASLRRIKRLWSKLGAKVILMSPEIHDRILARVSHLPHLVAYALVGMLLEMDEKNPLLRFSAGGFRDFTRIAESSPEMWRDICLENKEEVIWALEKYEKELLRIKGWIKRDQAQELERFFSKCRKVKEKLKSRNG